MIGAVLYCAVLRIARDWSQREGVCICMHDYFTITFPSVIARQLGEYDENQETK